MRPGVLLAVVCLAAFAVNVDTTIVNVTLPSLVTDLGATTRELQWVVDAYLLVFAALVLAGGSLGDRFGRRRLLVAGLVVFGLANGAAALCTTPEQLIAARAVAGLGAAAVFPATLSIISDAHRDRAARARAIGLWGASTGLAVAVGPITGGALLEGFWWGSTFAVKVPLALVAVALVLAVVPESKDPAAPRLDIGGLVLSALGLGALVVTVIEAPEQGWGSTRSVAGFAAAAVLFALFARHEGRTRAPLLDLALFRDRRFTAAAASITICFFALFGFIFLITQYFQLVRGYGALEAGVRTLPVALSIAAGSIVGSAAVGRLGNKLVVTAGLVLLAGAYGWIAFLGTDSPYTVVAAQMVLLGLGMGLTSAPATESVMGAVSTDKAGVGSAVNDATREVGGTLGVAVIGSVFASLYTDALDGVRAALPPGLGDLAAESVGAASAVAAQLPPGPAEALREAATTGFLDGLQAGCLVAAGVALAGAVLTALALPARPGREPQPGGEAAPRHL